MSYSSSKHSRKNSQQLLRHVRVCLDFFHLLIRTNQHFMLRTKGFQSSVANALALVGRSLHLVQNSSSATIRKRSFLLLVQLDQTLSHLFLLFLGILLSQAKRKVLQSQQERTCSFSIPDEQCPF